MIKDPFQIQKSNPKGQIVYQNVYIFRNKSKIQARLSFRVDLMSSESSEPKDGDGVLKFCTVSMRVLESMTMIETLSNLSLHKSHFIP